MTIGQVALLSMDAKKIERLPLIRACDEPWERRLAFHRDMERHAGRPIPAEIEAALEDPEQRKKSVSAALADYKRELRLKFTGNADLMP